MGKSRSTTFWVVWSLFIAVCIGFMVYFKFFYGKPKEIRVTREVVNTVDEEAKKICLEYGIELLDESVKKGILGFDVDYTMSGFEKLSFEKMFEITEKLNSIRIQGLRAYTREIHSGDNIYCVYPSTLEIKLNGETIFDDYFNSPFHIQYSSRTPSPSESVESSTNDDGYLDTVRCVYCSKVIRSNGKNIHGTPIYNGGVLVCDYCGHKTYIVKK